MTRRPLSETGNSICPRLRSCQGLWATEGQPASSACRTWLARSENQPRNSLRQALLRGLTMPRRRQIKNRRTNKNRKSHRKLQNTNQLLQTAMSIVLPGAP